MFEKTSVYAWVIVFEGAFIKLFQASAFMTVTNIKLSLTRVF
jgi:hypothetical protein